MQLCKTNVQVVVLVLTRLSYSLLTWLYLLIYYIGGGVTPLRAPTPLCQNRVCLTRGVSPGAYRGAQGRSLKNTWKMFVFNCMIHFVTCIVTIFPIMELLRFEVSIASLI